MQHILQITKFLLVSKIIIIQGPLEKEIEINVMKFEKEPSSRVVEPGENTAFTCIVDKHEQQLQFKWYTCSFKIYSTGCPLVVVGLRTQI